MVDRRFFSPSCSYQVTELAALLRAELDVVPEIETAVIEGVSDYPQAQPTDLIYFADQKFADGLQQTAGRFCLVTAQLKQFLPAHLYPLVVEDVPQAFVAAIRLLFPEQRCDGAIHPTAVIDPRAQLGAGVTVGPYTTIGADARLADGVSLGSHVVIGDGVSLGAGTTVHSQCTISHALIDDACVIHTGARIGQAGFGFLPGAEGHVAIPQMGRVVIQSGCNIGANVTIDRGALSDTVIGPGCIIDNLVHIAHNVRMGAGCVIIAQTGISGSCELGNYVALAGQVGLADHVKIGDRAQIAAKTGIMSDVPAGQTYMGYPARPLKQFFREVATVKKLAKKRD